VGTLAFLREREGTRATCRGSIFDIGTDEVRPGRGKGGKARGSRRNEVTQGSGEEEGGFWLSNGGGERLHARKRAL